MSLHRGPRESGMREKKIRSFQRSAEDGVADQRTWLKPNALCGVDRRRYRLRRTGMRRWSTRGWADDNKKILKQNDSEFSGSSGFGFFNITGKFRIAVGRETYIRVRTQTEAVGIARDSYVSLVTCI